MRSARCRHQRDRTPPLCGGTGRERTEAQAGVSDRCLCFRPFFVPGRVGRLRRPTCDALSALCLCDSVADFLRASSCFRGCLSPPTLVPSCSNYSTRPLLAGAKRKTGRDRRQLLAAGHLLRRRTGRRRSAAPPARTTSRRSGRRDRSRRTPGPMRLISRSTHAAIAASSSAIQRSKSARVTFLRIVTGPDWNANSDSGRRRQLELRALHRLVQLVAELQLDQQQERLEPLGRRRRPLDPLQHLERLRRLQERQVVPALEPLVRPARDRQELVRRRQVFAAQPEPRRDQVADDALVERVAGDRHAVGADDVGRAPPARADARADRDDREVAGAAAEVADEDAARRAPAAPRRRTRPRPARTRRRSLRSRPGRSPSAAGSAANASSSASRGLREVHRPAEDDPPRRGPRREPELVAHVLAR